MPLERTARPVISQPYPAWFDKGLTTLTVMTWINLGAGIIMILGFGLMLGFGLYPVDSLYGIFIEAYRGYEAGAVLLSLAAATSFVTGILMLMFKLQGFKDRDLIIATGAVSIFAGLLAVSLVLSVILLVQIKENRSNGPSKQIALSAVKPLEPPTVAA